MNTAAHSNECSYCGLPLGKSRWVSQRDEPAYCCLGCRIAANVARECNDGGQARWTLARIGIAIFFTMNVMAFTMALWSQDVYADAIHNENAVLLFSLFRYICLLMSAPVLLLLAGPLLDNAWKNLFLGRPGTDLLLSLGVIVAYVYSVVSVVRGEGHIYFEVSCAVLVAVTLGRWLEATGRLKAKQALDSLIQLLPAKARRVNEGGEEWVALDQLEQAAQFTRAAGRTFPADGTIIRNCASIDEQLITGESRPTVREVGDAVIGGTLNYDGDISVRITAASSNGTLQRLATCAGEAALASRRLSAHC